ncbi:nickel-dependent hydrogenase large subunit [Marinobacterium arenosum]|uniref:nickel-dependent hydrogenase large subunit n=1 Tax=Marinobacterium arenosum TaxID=2862496 RepID=UPI001C945E5A|nr:nickel-dependent hydrogenase large subunit [Marinobacterium arenosum]MBY4677393.1 nickel-dependent hydrogenase large subunit [Marinobacterium arenosum]
MNGRALAANPVGELRIRLRLADEPGRTRIAAVEIDSSRPTALARLFVGRSVDQLLVGLPLLFALCGNAQRIAALQAVEQALGIEASESVRRARAQLLLAESGREQLLRLLRDWLGMPAELRPLLAAFNRFYAAYCDRRSDALRLAGQASSNPAVGHGLVSELQQSWLPLSELPLEMWLQQRLAAAEQSPVGRLLVGLQRRFGEVDLHQGSATLSALPRDWLHRQLQTEQSAAFCRAPTLHGEPRETGLWPRWRGAPLQRLTADQGLHPLVQRLLALLDELRQLPVRLLQAEPLALESAPAPGWGLATVDSARGLLSHQLRLVDGVVAELALLAPTEWNFHPAGSLVRQLRGVTVADRQQALALVRTLALLLDPCVKFDVEIGPDA